MKNNMENMEMMGNKKKMKECPCCDRHCPVDNLHCSRGKEFFGLSAEEKEEQGGHRHGKGFGNMEKDHMERTNMEKDHMTKEERVLVCIRQCGHYLHHSAGKDSGADSKALLAALTEEEKDRLILLLEKCIRSWNC